MKKARALALGKFKVDTRFKLQKRHRNLVPKLEEVKRGFAAGWNDPKAYAVKYVKEIPKELWVLDVVFGDEETGEGGDPTVAQNM